MNFAVFIHYQPGFLTYVENIGLGETAVCAFYVCLFVCMFICLYVGMYL